MAECQDIFCDFANKEIRRVYGLYCNLDQTEHEQVLGAWLNVAVFLCEEHCIIPLGFAAESRTLQRVLELKSSFLRGAAIRFPIRENELEQFILRRRREYGPYSSDYAPLYSSETIDFLQKYSVAFLERKGRSGIKIKDAWAAGPDVNPMWCSIRERLSGPQLHEVLRIPGHLADIGLGVTWNAVSERLPLVMTPDSQQARKILHHDFVLNYLAEYDLDIITRLPYGWRDLGIRREGGPNDFQSLRIGLGPLIEVIGRATAHTVLSIRAQPGYRKFISGYRAIFRGVDLGAIRELYSVAWHDNRKSLRQLAKRKDLSISKDLDNEAIDHLGFLLGNVAAATGVSFDYAGEQRAADRSPTIFIANVENFQMTEKRIEIGAGAHVAAPVTIADQISGSFNAAAQIEQPELKDRVERLLAELRRISPALAAPTAGKLTEEISGLVTEAVKDAPRQETSAGLQDRVGQIANTVGSIGKAGETLLELAHQVASFFQ